jgi:hypothetical protein
MAALMPAATLMTPSGEALVTRHMRHTARIQPLESPVGYMLNLAGQMQLMHSALKEVIGATATWRPFHYLFG